MTEQEWLSYELVDPGDLDELFDCLRSKVSERKLRLFACACAQFIEVTRTDANGRLAVEMAERFADGLGSAEERDAALHSLRPALASIITPEGFIPTPTAAALWPDAVEAAKLATRTVTANIYGCYVAYPDVSRDLLKALRDIVGLLPFQPINIDAHCLTSAVTSLAQVIYNGHAFERLPILADELEDAGCANQDILVHCRDGGSHVRGCWVVDALLGKR